MDPGFSLKNKCHFQGTPVGGGYPHPWEMVTHTHGSIRQKNFYDLRMLPGGIFFISDICWRTSLWARTHIKKPNFPNFMQFLLPANEVWGKVMFLHVSVILSTYFPVCITGHMTRGRESAFRGRGVSIQGREVCIWRGGLHQRGRGVCI